MRRHLDTLRAQPHHVRKQIAVGSSAVITFFIFMFWLSSTPMFSVPTETPKVTTATSTGPGPLTASAVGAWQSMVGFKNNVFKAFQDHQTYTAPPDVVEVVPEE